jgi:hypothetical protein
MYAGCDAPKGAAAGVKPEGRVAVVGTIPPDQMRTSATLPENDEPIYKFALARAPGTVPPDSDEYVVCVPLTHKFDLVARLGVMEAAI